MHLTNTLKHLHIKEGALKRVDLLEKGLDEVRVMTEYVDRLLSRKDAGEQEREERLRTLEERVLELEAGLKRSGRRIPRLSSRGRRGGVNSSSSSSSLDQPKPSPSKVASSSPPPVMIFWDSENCNISGQDVSSYPCFAPSWLEVRPELISVFPLLLSRVLPLEPRSHHPQTSFDVLHGTYQDIPLLYANHTRCKYPFPLSARISRLSVETHPSFALSSFQWDNLPTFRARIAANGVELRDCPSWLGKGTVDHTLLVEIMAAALDFPPPATIVLM